MRPCLILPAIIFSHLTSAANAAVTVSNLKTNQVIQRTSAQSAVYALSGTCGSVSKGIQVRVTRQTTGVVIPGWDWKSVEASITGTSWTGTLRDIPVGGEYSLAFRGTDAGGVSVESGVTVSNILVGDIWIGSGQSNMGGESRASEVEYVHVYDSYGNSWSRTRHNLSVAFGKTIFQRTGVPIGVSLVVCSGAAISFWGADQVCRQGIRAIIDNQKKQIAGFIWYQGETDSEEDAATGYQRAFAYRDNLQALIDDIRAYAGKPDLPALIVQVGGLYPAGSLLVRGAQYDIAKQDPHIATIPVYDLGADLHLSAERLDTAGARLGNAYLRKIAGYQDVWFGPQFSDAWFMDAEKKKIAVRFTDVKDSLRDFSKDRDRWGFFVMDTAIWRQNNRTMNFSYASPAGLLKAIDTILPLAADRICIQLKATAAAPVTIGYTRSSAPAIMPMSFIKDASGIPMAGIFGYGVANNPASGAESVPKRCSTTLLPPAMRVILLQGNRRMNSAIAAYWITGRRMRPDEFHTSAVAIGICTKRTNAVAF